MKTIFTLLTLALISTSAMAEFDCSKVRLTGKDQIGRVIKKSENGYIVTQVSDNIEPSCFGDPDLKKVIIKSKIELDTTSCIMTEKLISTTRYYHQKKTDIEYSEEILSSYKILNYKWSLFTGKTLEVVDCTDTNIDCSTSNRAVEYKIK